MALNENPFRCFLTQKNEPPSYLQQPSDASSKRKGALPLNWNEELLEAVKNKRLEQVRELVGSVKWDPSGPYVPVAAQWGHEDILEALLVGKANLDAMMWGKPAIMLAAESGHLNCVAFIVNNGGSRDALDLDGETALSRAENHDHKIVCNFLREVGAKEFSLRRMLKKRDVASVHEWVAAAEFEPEGGIEERDRRMALVHEISRISGDEVILLLAAQAGDIKEVKRLVEEQAVDPETRAADGKSALELAAKEGHFPVVQFLSLFADHGQVKAILQSLRPAAATAKKKSKGKDKSSKKQPKKKDSTNSISSKDSVSADGGDG